MHGGTGGNSWEACRDGVGGWDGACQQHLRSGLQGCLDCRLAERAGRVQILRWEVSWGPGRGLEHVPSFLGFLLAFTPLHLLLR